MSSSPYKMETSWIGEAGADRPADRTAERRERSLGALGLRTVDQLAASKMSASIATVLTGPMVIPVTPTTRLGQMASEKHALKVKQTKRCDKCVPTADTRTVNSTDKVCDVKSHMSVAETRHSRPAEFWDAWVKTDKDQVRDKRTIKDGVGAAPTSGAGSAPGSAPAAASFAGALPAAAASHHCSAPRRPRQPEPRKLWQPWQIRLGKHRRRLPTSS